MLTDFTKEYILRIDSNHTVKFGVPVPRVVGGNFNI